MFLRSIPTPSSVRHIAVRFWLACFSRTVKMWKVFLEHFFEFVTHSNTPLPQLHFAQRL